VATAEGRQPALGSSITWHFRGEVRFPPNTSSSSETRIGEVVVKSSAAWDVGVVTMPLGSLVARQERGGVAVELSSQNADIPQGVEWRLIEGLEFLENAPVTWCAVVRRDGDKERTLLRGDRYIPVLTRSLPPLPNTSVEDATNFWPAVIAFVQRA